MATPECDRLCRTAGELQIAASEAFVPLRVTAPPGRAFHAEVASVPADPVGIARIRGSAHTVTRDRGAVTSADPELFKVTLHRRGGALVAQDGRRGRARPGDLVVFDTSRPYLLAVPDGCDVVAVGVPRRALGGYADRVSEATARPLAGDRGVAAVIAAFLTQADAAPLDPHLADALVSLLIAGFARTTPEAVETPAALRDRITAYVRARLADPGLTARAVAHRHGISPRTLHRLFAGEERSFAAWVRYERLRRIRRDLTDPALAHRPITRIAADWGITDPGHLSRILRTEFGCTAAELRESAG